MDDKKERHITTLGIIPARGGSKGIPKKNIIDLGGKPLIAYAIEAAKKSVSVERLIVSTDDPEIAAVARHYGAEVPFIRPKEFAKDTTPMIAVVMHALQYFVQKENYRPEYVMLLQPTTPFVQSSQVDELFWLVKEKNADSGITMILVPRTFHPYHVRFENNEGFLEFEHDDLHYQYPTRQSDTKRYAFGNIYWFQCAAFIKKQQIEVGKRVGLEINSISAFDINDPVDLEIARLLLTRQQQ